MLVLRRNGTNTLANRQRAGFDNFFNDVWFNTERLRPAIAWNADVNLYEAGGNLVYEFELPGINRDEINVKLEDNRLTINGEIRKDEHVKNEQYFSVGRRYGKFERIFELPENVVVENPNKINAKLDNGILKISLPLKESLQPQTYEIKVN